MPRRMKLRCGQRASSQFGEAARTYMETPKFARLGLDSSSQREAKFVSCIFVRASEAVRYMG